MTAVKYPCTRMLAYKPPRIAISLLALASLSQLVFPANWAALPSLLTAGAATAALGFGIMLRAWWLFKRYDTAICPTATTTTFIVEDVYRLTRNPMYLGMILILTGIALLTGLWPYYVVAILYAVILDHVFCRYEESELLMQYGSEYAHYAARVRRWI
jgi:protein-S-isoprenylcysteine O-methyltransferase Ste14